MAIKSNIALKWLLEGNEDYINSKQNLSDISLEKRIHTHHHGQNPFAVIITCSDSRVIPESIFLKGIGDLFVIRNAGNVLDEYSLGSIEYAIEALDVKLIMVMGHTMCGAVTHALHDKSHGYVGKILDEIKEAISETNNNIIATRLNVLNTVNKINNKLKIKSDVMVIGSIYHTHSGRVELLKNKKIIHL